jgi:hypothetical protein
MMFYKMLELEKRMKWNKIKNRFITNDSPAGCKLSAVGCMERFNHSRDETNMTRKESAKRELSVGRSREECAEARRMKMITPGMSMQLKLSILRGDYDDQGHC